MAHPFKGKLFVFIGTPRRCTRQIARDALIAVGGIPDERITAFTNYVVALNQADKTKAYQKALKYGKHGLLSILTEEQFFNVLEGRAAPPEKPEPDRDIIVIPSAGNPEAADRDLEHMQEDIINRKRMNSLARDGVHTPDGRVKVDLRPLDTIRRVMKIIKEQE